MNAGILAPGYAPPQMPAPLLGQPQPVPTIYGPARDPYWASVSMYLRMDGPHGSQSFSDLSIYRKPVTANGSASVTGQRGVFGQSANFTGSPDYLRVADDSTTNLTADFTIEAFVRTTTSAGLQTIASKWNTTGTLGWILWLSSGNVLNFALGNSGTFSTQINRTMSFSYTSGAWNHFAVTRLAGVITLWANGRSVGATATNTSNCTAANEVRIGAHGANQDYLNGQIDEFRLTNGVARYASTFPVPTAPFQIGYQ